MSSSAWILLAALTADGAPQAEPDLDAVVASATQWLIDHQRENGAWGSHHSPRPIEVLCDVPGSHQAFRIATTSLCIMALMESPSRSPAAQQALQRGLDYLLSDCDVKRASGLEHYSVWAFGYGLQCLAQLLLEVPEDPRAEPIRDACRMLIGKLERYQCLDGGWGYLSLHEVPTYQPSFTSMSFTTASLLVGIHRALEAGLEVPEKMIRRAVDSVERCRTPTGSYTYGEIWNKSPARGINQLKGAACRTPSCQYALDLFGAHTPERDHQRSLEDLLVRHHRFQVASLRRPIPHESHYAISGYFYLFGCYYSALVLEGLSAELQDTYAGKLAAAVMVCHQPDGSFWDYPLYSYHKPYGTAYALLTLAKIQKFGQHLQDPDSETALDNPAAYLDHALDLIQERALFRDRIDWEVTRKQAHQQIETAQEISETYAAIRGVLQQLGDRHSFFREPAKAEAYRHASFAPSDSVASNPQLSLRFAEVKLLDDEIGYVKIPGFGSIQAEACEQFAAQMQENIAGVDGVDPIGWVVDLRGNTGGNCWPMLTGIAPVLGNGLAGKFVSAGEETHWGAEEGGSWIGNDDQRQSAGQVQKPTHLQTPDPWVAVLTDGLTASSGEVVTVAFRQRPKTRSFGSPTAGLSTANTILNLPDGAALALCVSTYADRTGNLYGKKIAPDQEITSDDPHGDVVLEAAIEWLVESFYAAE
jgi:hypothetical protein